MATMGEAAAISSDDAQKALEVAKDLVEQRAVLDECKDTTEADRQDDGGAPVTATAKRERQSSTGPVSSSLTTYAMLKEENLQKYWNCRYSLWSRFDEGVLMDREGWYSVTPEALAIHQAERLSCDIAADAFCGVGGNAVQLASTCQQVLATDISFERLLLAQHNAEVYGISHRIDFVCGNFLAMAPRFQTDAVFLSPPWGGPTYSDRQGSFDISKDIGGLGVNFRQLLLIADSALHQPVISAPHTRTARGIACFLPKRTSLSQVSEALPQGEECEVERNLLNRMLKSVTIYVGACASGVEENDIVSLGHL